MNGGGLNHLPLGQGIKDSYIKQRVAKGAVNWRMMEESFNSSSKHAKAAERTKLYHESRYDDITPINTIYSLHKVNYEYKHNFRGNKKQQNFKPEESKNNQTLECHYCNEPYYITNCVKFKADKDKYKLTTQKLERNIWKE